MVRNYVLFVVVWLLIMLNCLQGFRHIWLAWLDGILFVLVLLGVTLYWIYKGKNKRHK